MSASRSSTPPRRPRLRGRLLVAAATLLVLAAAGCVPGLRADGSLAVTATRAGDGWLAEVPARYAGRTIHIQRPLARTVTVHRAFVPPPGSCRLWYPDRAPALQPPVGPCPAEPTAPAGAYLLRG